MTAPLRAVVVDDSPLFRVVLRDALRTLPGVSVVGNASDGEEAVRKITELRPDVVTLDVEMPGMNGIDVLRRLKADGCGASVIMVSRHTAAGADVTTEALLEGAFDFVLKPGGADVVASKAALAGRIGEILAAARVSETATPPGRPEEQIASRRRRAELVLIGSSTGGPETLREIVPQLPAGLPAPVVIVQHMPAGYTASLARRLDSLSPLAVREAADGDRLRAGEVLIAPGGRHLELVRVGPHLDARLTDEPPEHGCRPAVDVLYRSAFETAHDRAILAVILTGMGRDGTDGAAVLKDLSARVIAQHADGCVVYGMPKAVIDAGLADRILPRDQIAAAIMAECGVWA